MGTGCRSTVLWRRESAARTGRRKRRESAQWLWPLLAPVGLGLVVVGGESWADPAIVSPNGLPVQVNPTFPEPGLPAFSFPQGACRTRAASPVRSRPATAPAAGLVLARQASGPIAARARGLRARSLRRAMRICWVRAPARDNASRWRRRRQTSVTLRRGLPVRRSRATPTSRSAQ